MMNDSNISGVNEGAIDNIILQLTQYEERLKKIFSMMENAINDVEQYYRVNSLVALKNKFDDVRCNFPIILNNIEKYIDDLATVKNNYKEFTTELSSLLNTNPDYYLGIMKSSVSGGSIGINTHYKEVK